MATRSSIGILTNKNEIHSIYCHSDGYLEHNGCLLFVHYSDVEKLKQLISLGNISALDKDLYSGKTVAYSRDMGEPLQKNKCDVESLQSFRTNICFDYTYVFKEKNKKWYIFSKDKDRFVSLEAEIKRKIKEKKLNVKYPYVQDFIKYQTYKKLEKNLPKNNDSLIKVSKI